MTTSTFASLDLWRVLASSERMQGDFPWEHPATTALPLELARNLEHARLLSETMYGAALLYNLMLTEGLPPDEKRDELLERRRAALADWCEELSERALAAWNHDDFWRLPRKHANLRQKRSSRFCRGTPGRALLKGSEVSR